MSTNNYRAKMRRFVQKYEAELVILGSAVIGGMVVHKVKERRHDPIECANDTLDANNAYAVSRVVLLKAFERLGGDYFEAEGKRLAVEAPPA